MNPLGPLIGLLMQGLSNTQDKVPRLSIKELASFLPSMRKLLPRFIGLLFLVLLVSIVSLPAPAITGKIIDKVFIAGDANKLNFYVGILLGILMLSELAHVIQEYLIVRLSQESAFIIQSRLVERILSFPLSYFRRFKTGYLVSRLDEANLLASFISGTVPFLGESTIRFIGALFLISRYNLILTLTALCFLPLFFEIARRTKKIVRSTSLESMEKGANLRGKIQETLSGIELVKTSAKEESETADIKTDLRKLVELQVFQSLFNSASGRVLSLITGVNLLAILWVGGHEIMAGRLSIGQYVAFTAYIAFLYGPIQLFTTAFLQLQRALVSAKRISELEEATSESEIAGGKAILKHISGKIGFENVCFSYNAGSEVIHSVTFSILPGERVALVGKSGAGKTTLMHLILGLCFPASGCIKIDDTDLRDINLISLRKRIGIVSQNIFLFGDSILNNIRYSRPKASHDEIVEAAKIAGCHSFITRLKEGYETNAGEIGSRLSGGEKQRISIARCLLKDPDLIIFDEPTSNIDPILAKSIMSSINDILKLRTCIMIGHDMLSLSLADRIISIEDGYIVYDGLPTGVLTKEGAYNGLAEHLC